MSSKSLCAALLMLAAICGSSNSVASACYTPKSDRPKIGLVLGGGGARGAAHVGVIRKLEELRIPVDVIAGTSMGSIIGGFYATGMNATDLEELIRGIDWAELFTDGTRRSDQPFRRKRDDDLSLFGPKLGVGKGSTLLPQGAISGQKLAFFFDAVINQHVHTRDFDQLPIPYRAIAADVITGNQVVLADGDLGMAMRSSMSIPGAFSPVSYKDYMLIDGGIVNNVPVDVARSMGADIVIAVDVGTPLYEREELTDLVSITAQLTGFLVVGNVRQQLATLGSQDFNLQPKLGTSISATDFDSIGPAIPRGYEAADAVSERLSVLSLSPEAYASYREQVQNCQVGLPTIQFVELDNSSRFKDEVIASHINTAIGEPLDIEQLEVDIQQIYSLGFLETARYELVERNGEQGVIIHVEQDKRGTDFLEWGFDLFGDADSSELNLRLGYLKTDVDKLGAELRGLVQVGEDTGFLAEYYKPLENTQRLFFIPSVYGERREIIQFDGVGNRINEFQLSQYGASAFLAKEFNRHASISAGLAFTVGEVRLDIGDPTISNFNFDSAAYVVQAQYDRLDDSYFPSDGTSVQLSYQNFNTDLGSDDEFEQIQLAGFKAWTANRHTLIAGGTYQTTLNDNAPIQSRFRGGGFTRLSGLQENEISGQHFGVVFGSYRYKISESAFLPGYLGATLEYGNATDERNNVFNDGIFAGSVYMGFRSPIGPLYLGYGFAEGGAGNYFLRIGNIFKRTSLGR